MSDRNYELEFLKLENAKLKLELKEATPGINPNELMELVKLASDMRHLLERCRQLQMSVEMAKSIDMVLGKAREFDE